MSSLRVSPVCVKTIPFREFSPSQVGVRPEAVLIDGAIVQTFNQSFALNGESALDLEYGMALTHPQPVTLLQVGDLAEGASFNNWLDAVDESYCGGDDPILDGIYPDPLPGGYDGPESCGIIKPPNVVSISYGANEGLFPIAYLKRQCWEYAKVRYVCDQLFPRFSDFAARNDGDICDLQ